MEKLRIFTFIFRFCINIRVSDGLVISTVSSVFLIFRLTQSGKISINIMPFETLCLDGRAWQPQMAPYIPYEKHISYSFEYRLLSGMVDKVVPCSFADP